MTERNSIDTGSIAYKKFMTNSLFHVK